MITKKMILVCLVVGLAGIFNLKGQTQFEVPINIELQKMKDFEKYELAIVEAAKWLEETDLDKEIDKRQKVNAFVLEWAT
ncbi:MAG: hypothetical protein HYZ42_06755, partial [Bacteroidetes bacterium]|nr:hypothetical protein [Bacteroidota bacterium]